MKKKQIWIGELWVNYKQNEDGEPILDELGKPIISFFKGKIKLSPELVERYKDGIEAVGWLAATRRVKDVNGKFVKRSDGSYVEEPLTRYDAKSKREKPAKVINIYVDEMKRETPVPMTATKTYTKREASAGDNPF